MIHKLIWPAAVLAVLLLAAEILNLSAMQHFGAILSIVGIAFCLLAHMSARLLYMSWYCCAGFCCWYPYR